MSSLSQEDLDAGWDDEPEPSAAAKTEAANAASQSLAPPNSITIEKTPAPVESIIVRSAPPDDTQLVAPDASAASPLPALDTSPEVESSLQAAAPEAQTSLEATALEAESNLEPTVPPASGPLSPTLAIPAETTQSSVSDSLASSIVGEAVAPEASLDQEAIEHSLAEAPRAAEIDVQLDLFTTVAEKPQLLAEKGVDTGVAAEPFALEGPASEVEALVPFRPAEITSVLPETDVTARPEAALNDKSDVNPVVSLDPRQPEPVALEAPSSATTESFAIRHWRSIALAAAVALFAVAGLLSIRSKHSQARTEKPTVSTKIGDMQSGRATPGVISNPAAVPIEAAAIARTAAPVAIGAPEPARPTPAAGAQAESFSDAFVKHAATVNSSWADVKKRPKAVESSQSNKPVAASAAKTNDNPLDVLDKLEKARKAKKAGAK